MGRRDAIYIYCCLSCAVRQRSRPPSFSGKAAGEVNIQAIETPNNAGIDSFNLLWGCVQVLCCPFPFRDYMAVVHVRACDQATVRAYVQVDVDIKCLFDRPLLGKT